MWSLLLLLSQPAQAAKIARCEVALDLPVGAVEVPGFGATDDEALAHARRFAAALGAWHAHAELMAGLLVDPIAAVGRHVALLRALDTTAAAAAPGYEIRDRGCGTTSLPANKPSGAWSAVWADPAQPIVRADPALAIEAARRRACFGAFQQQLHAALARAEAGVGPEGWRSVVFATADARDQLLRCATEVSPSIVAAAPLPFTVADPADVFRCGRPRRDGEAWTTTPGFGPTLEAAREAALARDLVTVAQRSAADALRTFRGRDPTLAIGALEPARTLVVGPDPIEQASLLCASGPPVQARFAWTPAEGCGDAPPSFPVVPSASALEELVGPRCWTVLASGTAQTLGRLTGDRGADDPVAAQGLAAALSCVASCARDADVDGWTTRPARLPGEVDRSTRQAATAAFADAIARRDFATFALLSGGVLFHPSYAVVAEREPDAFWGSLEQARKAGKLDDVARWDEVEGHWLLGFR